MAAMVWLFLPNVSAAGMRELSRISIEEPGAEFELRSAALAPDAATVEIVALRSTRAQPQAAESLVWLQMSRSGQVSPAVELSALLPAAAGINAADPAAGTLLVPVPDGILLLHEPAAGSRQLLRFPRTPGSALIKPLAAIKGSPAIRRAVWRGNGRVLLGGSLGSGAWLGEIDLDGAVLRQFTLPAPELSVTDLELLAGGEVLALGESGTAQQSRAWLGRLTPAAKVLAKALVEGRPTAMARATDGSYAVLANKTGKDGFSVVVTLLTKTLEPRSTRTLVAGQLMEPDFRIVGAASGGFLVAGIRDRGLWISRIGQDAEEVWTQARTPAKTPDMEIVSRLRLMSGNGEYAVVYSAFAVRDRTQRRVVRAVRFAED